MIDLFDYLCSVMKKKSVYILLVSLLIISGAYGQGNLEITLSNNPSVVYSMLPPSINTANVTILTQNVILQANIDGKWEKSGETISTTNTTTFDVITLNLAGLYEFLIVEGEASTLAIQIEISVTGVNMAEFTLEEEYNILSGNEVFNTSTTLACATSSASEPLWKYKEVQTDSYINQSSTTWDSATGISTITITITQQGYYTCTPIAIGDTYTVAIFNPDVTVEVTSQDVKAFTRGIDLSQLQLLCRSSDTNVHLDNIQWNPLLSPSTSLQNPFIVSELSSDIILQCKIGSTQFLYTIFLKGPPALTITDTSGKSYTQLPPENNTADITVFNQNILLEVNLVIQYSLGRWVTPFDPEITTTSTIISEFTANLAGLYTFYVINFLGNEELAIQIQITAIGSNFAELTPSNEYTLLSGNNIFYTDTTLVCVTSDTSIQPVWSHRETQQGVDSTPTSAIWDDSTGISRLDIVTTQQGYYTCTITGVQPYNVAIFNPDVTTNATAGQQYTYTRGIDSSDTQLLCTSDSNTTLSSIKWGIFPNPLILQSLQNQESTISCKVGSSTILHVDLLVQGPPQITLSTTSDTYTELPNSVNVNTADINVLSKNVMLQVNIKGRWELPDGSSSNESVMEFELFTKDLDGMYKFYVSSWNGSEVLAIQIEISAVGTLAEESSQGIYNILSGNEVFNTSTTLACATSDTSKPEWKYKEVQTDTYITQSSTTWDSTTGISTINITTTQQGYYTCITGGVTYTVAIFNPDVTVEVTSQVIKAFTRGIDSSQLQLLCRSSDTNIPLDDIQWTSILDTSLRIPNPFIVSTLSNGIHYLKCNRGNTPFNNIIIVQGPPTLTITNTSSTSYTMLPPENNTADITVFSQNILLEVNLVIQNSLGRWVTPFDPEITTTSAIISEFTANLAGLYTFYVINFLGNEELAIQIQITAIGSNFAELTPSNEYTLLSGNNIFYTDTTLVCVTSDTSIQPVWSHRETQQGVDSTPTSAIWDDSTGISRLYIVTTQQGYYTCIVTGVQSYNVAIFNPDVTIIAIDGQRYTYTRGIDPSDTQLLCTSDSNTTLSSIKWGTFPNPLILQSLQNQESTINCKVGSSTILQVDLLVQGPPQITLSTTSDIYTELLNSDNANTAEITVLSKNVMLQVNINGRWELPDGSSNTESVIEFELFTKNLAGVYKFYVSSWDGSEVLAIQIEISVGGNFAELTSPGVYNILSGNEVFNTDTTLACATSGASEPLWKYKEVQTDLYVSQSSTTWNSITGISTLTITTTQQGYYTCTPKAGETTYTVAILNPDVTVEVTSSDIKVFTRGIDSSQLQLLCRSSDTNIPLDDIQWTSILDTSLSIPNPFFVNTLSNGNHYLKCNRASTPFNYAIIVQGPPTLTITDTFSTSYTLLPPENNTADITVFSQNILLEVNLVTQSSLGRWVTPLDPEVTTTSTTISVFTANLAGLYTFYVVNFLGYNQIAIQIDISAIGTNFAEITSQGLYKLLYGDEVLYNDTTLACATSGTSQPQWNHKENQNANSQSLAATSWDPTTGISTLNINITQYGHYTCTPISGTTYTVSIYNLTDTIVANISNEIQYTNGTDLPQLKLLCRPATGETEVNWKSSSIASTLQNPFTILSELNSGENILTCMTNGTVLFNYTVFIQGPPRLTINTSTSVESYTNMINYASFRVFTQNISLGINLRMGTYGRWEAPIVPEIISSSVMIPEFTADLDSSYKFYVTNYLNTEMVAIRIQISATGSNFAEITQSNEYTLLSGNNIFYTETTLVCVTNDTSIQPVWSYRETQQVVDTTLTGAIWNDSTGISRLDIGTTQQGYYTCITTGGSAYTVAIFNPAFTTNATGGQEYTFTKNIDSSVTQLLCTPVDSNTALSDVKWGFYDNPLFPNSAANQDAATVCSIVSSSSIILSVNLVIQGPPEITLSTTPGITYTNLTTSGGINNVDIVILSRNVMLQSNLKGNWKLPNGSQITGDSIQFELFTKNLTGMYGFYVTSWNGTKVLAIQIQITAVVINIAELTSSGEYNILSGNEIFNTSTTLACATIGASEPEWKYKEVRTDSYFNQSSTTWDSTTGISTITISTTQQGYYTCTPVAGGVTYTVAIFNPDVTVEVTSSDIKVFTRGIDSPQLQLLCRSSETNIQLDDIQWTSIHTSLSIPNPFIVSTLSNDNHYLNCNRGSTPFNYTVIVQGPPTLTITDTFSTSYTLLPPDINTADITVFNQNILLEVNMVTQNSLGRWVTPLDPEITTSSTTISEFTANLAGLYTFNVINLHGNEELAIQIQLALVGTAFLTVSDGTYEKLENNLIINTTDTIMLACATSNMGNTEDRVSWYFQENSTSPSNKETSELNDTTGLSVLEANKTGYYHCYVKDHNGDMMRYSVRLIELSEHAIPIRREDFMNSEPRSFTIGEPLQYYYQNASIPITAIRWGIDPSDDEDTDREFHNPVRINDVFNRFGSGAIQLSCFYRQSPATIVGYISIDMKDIESLTIEYEGDITTFSDLTNHNFPVAENITIQILSKNVIFSCSLSSCQVLEDNSNTPINLVIDTIRIEHNGTYSLSRMTKTGTSYTTAAFTLNVTGFIKQNITNVYSSVINANSANITWDLLTDDLPDNADQLFNITYQIDGGEEMFAGNTQDEFFYIPDLTAGVTYTVWVELSYTYTIVKDKMSIQVVIPGIELILIIIIVVVVLILLLVAIAVILLILCIWKFRGKSDKKFQALKSDENELQMKPPGRSSRDFQYSPISPRIDNLAYNPVLTESLPKFNQSASRDSRNYQNLPDVKDPRVKPIPLEMYKKTINKLWEDENALEDEYKSLGGEILRYECRNAQFDQNRIKNKYKFIYPYDKSRVVLKKIEKDVHSDYINASHIPGTYVTENFIAAQGPKVNTIQDVWRMVFEQNIRNIVMVTNCIEGGKLKCEEYFPSKDGKTNEYEQYKVKTVSMTQDVGHITRVLKIQSPTESIQVKHFHFTAWPDHDVPSLHDELLQFIGYVQDNITKSEAPILVHCSAGVGRTGTFITLFNLRAEILKRQPISIYHLVNEMREHRPHMVQTFRQYKFIYLAVLELMLDNTSILADEFSNAYQNYLKSDQTGYVSVFYQQFSELNYQCEKSFEYATYNGEDNEEKNPIPHILPYDNNRVVIYSPHFECGYINASYHENNLFITTLHPTANTLLDFLQMIYQTDATLVVMLSTAKEKAKIQGNMSERKAYWPNKDVPLEVPPFQVEVVNSEKSTSMVKQKIILRNLQESSERVFTQVISTSWTEKSDLTDLPSVLNLLHTVIHHRQEYPNGTIIMHCADSISKTGVMFTVYQCIKEMERTGKVDIFHTVKRLRRERMKLIPELAQFLACFSLMNEYCSSK